MPQEKMWYPKGYVSAPKRIPLHFLHGELHPEVFRSLMKERERQKIEIETERSHYQKGKFMGNSFFLLNY